MSEQLRALYHDVRGVLAAATANAEYLRAQSLPEELRAVAGEIEQELRLVGDVIALLGGADPARVVEVDLRAVLLVARGRASLQIDASQPSFPLRARRDALDALGAELVAACGPGASLAVEERACTLRGVEPSRAAPLVNASVWRDSGVSASVDHGTLLLRRND